MSPKVRANTNPVSGHARELSPNPPLIRSYAEGENEDSRQEMIGSDNGRYVLESESDSESDDRRIRDARVSLANDATSDRGPQKPSKSKPPKSLAKHRVSDNGSDPGQREQSRATVSPSPPRKAKGERPTGRPPRLPVAARPYVMTAKELREALGLTAPTYWRHACRGEYDRFECKPRIGHPRYSRQLVEQYLRGDPVYAKPDFERKGK